MKGAGDGRGRNGGGRRTSSSRGKVDEEVEQEDGVS